MTENPQTLGQQILNLAEGVGVQLKALRDRLVLVETGKIDLDDYVKLEDLDVVIKSITSSTDSETGLQKITITDTEDNSTDFTIDVPKANDTYQPTSSEGISGKGVADALGGYVEKSTSINNKALTDNITINATDLATLETDPYTLFYSTYTAK